MRISKIEDQLSIVDEIVYDKELALIMLGGFPPTWETFSTTIGNNNKCPSFDQLLGKCGQEEARRISKGRIPKHEEGIPITFVFQDKK